MKIVTNDYILYVTIDINNRIFVEIETIGNREVEQIIVNNTEVYRT